MGLDCFGGIGCTRLVVLEARKKKNKLKTSAVVSLFRNRDLVTGVDSPKQFHAGTVREANINAVNID